MNITEGNKLEMDNVLSYRKKLTESEMIVAVNDMLAFIGKIGAKTTGPVVKATYTMSKGVADIEILIPIDRKPLISGDYEYKPVFRLKNALKMEYTGIASEYPAAVHQLTDYMLKKKLTPITVGYSIENNTAKHSENDCLTIETYIGISENIL